MKRCIFLLFFSLFWGGEIVAQTQRGTLVTNVIPLELDRFMSQGKLDLVSLREVTHFLTNLNDSIYLKMPVKKRKKAFIRHIKHLSEHLELYYFQEADLDTVAYEYLFELLLFEQALIQSTLIGDRGPNLTEKIKMFLATKTSKQFFKFQVPAIEETNAIKDPPNSPYWHSYNLGTLAYKRFGELAKEKKIKRTNNMVVLFDGLSHSGSAPKIKTLDLDLDNKWVLKWGDEVHTDVVGSRIFAALGYDVDHPYYYGEDQLTLVFSLEREVQNAQQLKDSIWEIYHIDLTPFISDAGWVSEAMVAQEYKLTPFLGKAYVRFKKCGLEARPDRVKRIGPSSISVFGNENRKELKGGLLAHAFIDNWDTREANTLLTTVHNGDYDYRVAAAFSDLGTSFGVAVSTIPVDFKVGLVNAFKWEVVKLKENKVVLNYRVNHLAEPYKKSDYNDLKWMAKRIAMLTELDLRKIVKKAGWPKPIAELYFHKLASRRASIVTAFQLLDAHPIAFDRNLTIIENGQTIIQNGVLLEEYDPENNPAHFLNEKGRFRNYGNK